MKSIKWLHFTDLHFGLAGQEWLWPTYRKNLFEDLKRLSDSTAGPWDFVLFTGDLTQSATEEQYAKLTETLGQLWDHFSALGCTPIFLSIPGNHDLLRPESTSSVVKAFRHWHEDEDLRSLFWSTSSNEYRDLITQCFANYCDWWQKLSLPKPSIMTTGLLPGDFSAVIDKSGFRVGIAGLNTAFLQLTAGDYDRKLDLHEQQLCIVCDGDPDAWCKQSDIALLMTHHGCQYLNETAEQRFLSEIYPPGRFFSHIYGHLHQPSFQSFSQGGAEERRFRQGPSMFGRKTWGTEKNERIHGYTAGEFMLSGQDGVERCWPRRLTLKMAGHYGVSADTYYDLDEDNCVATKFSLKDIPEDIASSQNGGSNKQEFTLPVDQKVKTTDEVDTFGVSISILSDQVDIKSTKKKLGSVPRFKLTPEPQHYNIRQAEQARFESLLLDGRCAWLLSDWGLGKEGFLSCVLERLSRRKTYEIYRLACEEADNLLQFEYEVVKQFGMSLQEFCTFNTAVGNSLLILDDVSPNLFSDERENNLSFHKMILSMLDFCPDMSIILVSRQISSNTPYDNVTLKPLEINETANYIADHPKAGAELRDGETIDTLHLRSEGLIMHLERLIDTLQVSSLRELVDLELDIPSDHILSREPVPKALKQAVSALSLSSDRYTRRSYRMLKVLSVLPEGESLQAIRRTYPTEPLYPQNAIELINLLLLRVEAQSSAETTITSSEPCVQTEGDNEDKRLYVPRQVRDYVNSVLTKQEREDILRCSADLLFGDKWREGKIRVSRIKTLGARGARSTGPGNEHAVVLHILLEAIQREDSNEISLILALGVNYCRNLLNYNRYRDGCIATEDLLSLIEHIDFSKQYIELSIIRGKCLRMTGHREKSLQVFQDVLGRDLTFLAKNNIADIHLAIALIHNISGKKEEAIESAQMVQKLSKKGTAFYLQAASIIVSLQEKDPERMNMLLDLEKRARIKGFLAVANNIALDLSRQTDDVAKRISLVDRVLSGNDDHYNRIRAVINKANFLLSQDMVEDLTSKDRQLLGFAYSFLFSQRLTKLFAECHKALWMISKYENKITHLLRMFRLSSFLWRIRGEEETELKYLEEVKIVDLTEARRLNDERINIDIGYFERRNKGITIS